MVIHFEKLKRLRTYPQYQMLKLLLEHGKVNTLEFKDICSMNLYETKHQLCKKGLNIWHEKVSGSTTGCFVLDPEQYEAAEELLYLFDKSHKDE